MKKLAVLIVCTAVMASCDSFSGGSKDQLKAENDSLLMELTQRNAELDEMMGTFNDISEGFRQINAAESRVDLQRGAVAEGSLNAKQQIASDIEFIRKQMEEEGHVYFLAYEECEAAGYVSVQQQGEDLFHLQKIYVLPYYQGAHCGSFLFREAIKYIKEVHPGPCLMELNVNRNNKALQFYEHMGMRKLREGDFPIGNGYYMNDYIMGLDI